MSRDAGASWTRISSVDNTELRPVVSLAFHPTNNKILYAGTTHLPWRTSDGGGTWESIHTGMIDDSDVFSIQVDARQPEHVMASACSGVYNSVDGASHWTKLDTPKGAFRTHFVAIDPRHEGVVFAGTTEGLLKSDNGGKAWRKVSAYSVRSVAFDSQTASRMFFASSDGGLLVSNDEGSTLRESNFGFSNRNFTVLAGTGLALYSSSIYEPGSGGVYRTENLGLRWVHSGSPSGDELVRMATAPDDEKRLYAAGYHGLFESRDGGQSWAPRKTPADAAAVTALMPLPGGVLLAGTATGLFRSAEAGTWTQRATSGTVQLLQLSSRNVVTVLTPTGAQVSADNGITWKACGEAGLKSTLYGLAFDVTSSTRQTPAALAATSSGLFRSTDGCQTWSKVRAGLNAETVSVVLFHPTRPGEAFISQGGRIFVSTDGGQRWQPIDDEAPGNSGPASLLILPAAPDRLFALFPRRGVYSTGIGMWSTAQSNYASVASEHQND